MAEAIDPKAAYLADFSKGSAETARSEPSWLSARRAAAIRRFAELGFPTTKHEDWKYTNVGAIARTRFRPAASVAPVVPPESVEGATFGSATSARLVFLNGVFSPAISNVPAAVGVRVANLPDVLDHDGGVEPVFGRIARAEANSFTALNTAFAKDGAFVHVPTGRHVDAPIHLVFLSVPAGEPWISHPRNLILLSDGSEATIVETYLGLDGGVYFTNGVTEVVVGENAVLDHVKVQREGMGAFHVATMDLEQGRNANVSCTTISLGGRLVRSDLNTIFTGEGGEISMSGLFALSDQQHFDTHTQIDHRTPRCTSRELYKGILDGTSRGVFNGKIFVRRGAQKTVARQTNKNLLLSKDAHVDSTPGLEILADDVKCAHGSTIGQLDENAIFYLRSRGIEQETARSLLTYAFGAEIVNLISVAALRKGLDELVLSRLPNSEAVREAL